MTKAHIDQAQAELGGRIDHVEAKLSGRIDQVESRLDRLDNKIDAVEANLAERITSAFTDAKAHTESALREQARTFYLAMIAAYVSLMVGAIGIMLSVSTLM